MNIEEATIKVILEARSHKEDNEKSRAYLDSKRESKKLTEGEYADYLQEQIRTEDDLDTFKNWLSVLKELLDDFYDEYVEMSFAVRSAVDKIFNEDTCPSYCIKWLSSALEDLTNIAETELKISDEENEEKVEESYRDGLIAIFFDDNGYHPLGDHTFYTHNKTRTGALKKIMAPDFAKAPPYTNFVLITPAQYDSMTGSDWEKMGEYIKEKIKSGDYYKQKV